MENINEKILLEKKEIIFDYLYQLERRYNAVVSYLNGELEYPELVFEYDGDSALEIIRATIPMLHIARKLIYMNFKSSESHDLMEKFSDIAKKVYDLLEKLEDDKVEDLTVEL